MRSLRKLCLPSIFPIFLSPYSSPSLSVSRFGSYVYFILRFLPLAESPSPSTSTNILIIPWKPPRLRVLTRSWKTRPSEPPRGSVLSLPFRASLNFALELYSLSRSRTALPSFSPASVALTFVTMESIHWKLPGSLVVFACEINAFLFQSELNASLHKETAIYSFILWGWTEKGRRRRPRREGTNHHGLLSIRIESSKPSRNQNERYSRSSCLSSLRLCTSLSSSRFLSLEEENGKKGRK